MKQIRQGDVLLVAVEKVPPVDAKQVQRVILAEGELTGHAHQVIGDLLEWTEDDERFIRAIEESAIQHEDHDPEPVKVLQTGVTYRVIQQHERTIADEWKPVLD